jgi:hypothetical protein
VSEVSYGVNETIWKVGPSFTATHTGAFAAGTEYRADNVLYANLGYTFADAGPDDFDSVSGFSGSTDITLVVTDDTHATLQVTYPATDDFELTDLVQSVQIALRSSVSDVTNSQTIHYDSGTEVLTFYNGSIKTATLGNSGVPAGVKELLGATGIHASSSVFRVTGGNVDLIQNSGGSVFSVADLPLAASVDLTIQSIAGQSLTLTGAPNSTTFTLKTGNKPYTVNGVKVTTAAEAATADTIATDGSGNLSVTVNASGAVIETTAAVTVNPAVSQSATLNGVKLTPSGTGAWLTNAADTTEVTVKRGGADRIEVLSGASATQVTLDTDSVGGWQTSNFTVGKAITVVNKLLGATIRPTVSDVTVSVNVLTVVSLEEAALTTAGGYVHLTVTGGATLRLTLGLPTASPSTWTSQTGGDVGIAKSNATSTPVYTVAAASGTAPTAGSLAEGAATYIRVDVPDGATYTITKAP